MDVVWLVVLASVYTLALAMKSRDRAGFASYLRPLAGDFTQGLVSSVLVAEALLVATLGASVFVPATRPAAGIGSAAFLLCATAFYARLLSRTKPSRCHCFGSLAKEGAVRDPAWDPALVGARNGALIYVSLLAAGGTVVPGNVRDGINRPLGGDRTRRFHQTRACFARAGPTSAV